MTTGEIMPWVSLAVTLLLGLLVYRTNRGANRTNEKKLSIEEQIAEDERGDRIAERRRVELERLYERVEKLEALTETLKKELEVIQEERDMIVKHVAVLEAGWPNPPGPPPRPWLTHLRPL